MLRTSKMIFKRVLERICLQEPVGMYFPEASLGAGIECLQGGTEGSCLLGKKFQVQNIHPSSNPNTNNSPAIAVTLKNTLSNT